ncbi:ABC transporter permease [Embleya sp. NPDC056575]|uniref:ABC transporter permease n=1 Tax=unclassified Embleya TaxID=2699296 RepID=UPI0036C63695
MLTLAGMRARWVSFLGSFVGLGLGVTILATTGVVLLSSGPETPERFAAAPVLVRSGEARQPAPPFDDGPPWSAERARRLADRLAAVPGVGRVVVDRSFYAQVVIGGHPAGDPRFDDPLGHGWSSAALAAHAPLVGRPPATDHEVVLDRRLGPRPGDTVTVLTASGPAPYTVSGLVDGPGIYLTDGHADRLAGGVRVLGLLAGAGATLDPAAVRAVVGAEGRVLTGSDRAELEPGHAAFTRWVGLQVLSAMAALAAFTTVFVVASTFALSVAGRRREFALLRTIGATPKQVRRALFAEAGAVAALAAGLGVVLGGALSPAFAAVLVDLGFEPEGFTAEVGVSPLAGAFALGMLVAMAGVWSASRRAARIAPLEALREADVDNRPMSRGRVVGGLLFVALGVVSAAVTATADPRALADFGLYPPMALIVGLTMLAPAVVPPVVRVLTWPLSRGAGAIGLLVREGMLTAVRRTAATAAPVLATVGLAVLITGMVATTAQSYEARRTASVRAERVIVPDDTPGLTDAAVAEVAGTPLTPTTVYGDKGAVVEAAGVGTDEFAAIGDRVEARQGSFAELRGPTTMAVSESAAARLGWRHGGDARVTFRDGTIETMRVVAVLADRSTPYDVLLPRGIVRAHDPSALTAAVFRTGSDPAPAPLGGKEVSVAAYASSADAEEQRLVWIFTVLLVVVSVGYTAIAIANTLMMATADRLPDLRVLRLSGATVRQALCAIAAESAIVVTIGTALGAVVAVPSLLSLRSALSDLGGASVPLVVPWPLVGGVIATCLTAALTASVGPAWAALRPNRHRIPAG